MINYDQIIDNNQLIEAILSDAIKQNASDVHIEPQGDFGQLRYRIDGVLYIISHLPPERLPYLISCLKNRAQLNITEKRLPQDGSFKLSLTQQEYQCRLSCCPTIHGEKVVIRLLKSDQTAIPLTNLGLSSVILDQLKTTLDYAQGLIIITGPTGSGKTTTLYSILHYLNHSSRNITTIENPVEIQLPGINQIEVNYAIGLDFTTILRATLRQDPDVIMIGEIRDGETAQIAINAAHTGHLVLATLHTNSAANTISRLLNMGVQPFNLAHSLKLVIAQRLVRKLCSHCKKQVNATHFSTLAENIMNFPTNISATIYEADHCPNCHDGYTGRLPIFEYLPIDTTTAELLATNNSSAQIETQLNKLPYLKIATLALQEVNLGNTSLAEIKPLLGDA